MTLFLNKCSQLYARHNLSYALSALSAPQLVTRATPHHTPRHTKSVTPQPPDQQASHSPHRQQTSPNTAHTRHALSAPQLVTRRRTTPRRTLSTLLTHHTLRTSLTAPSAPCTIHATLSTPHPQHRALRTLRTFTKIDH